MVNPKVSGHGEQHRPSSRRYRTLGCDLAPGLQVAPHVAQLRDGLGFVERLGQCSAK